MSIQISDIVSTDIFSTRARVIAGSKGLNRQVNSITVMEVKDFTKHTIEKNLLILTTFSNFSEKVEEMERVFYELIEKNIAGLVVKINRYLEEVPEALSRIAEDNNVPLIELDKSALFSDVILSVASLIINAQHNTLQLINKEYEIMNNLILRGESIDDLMGHIGTMLKINCYYYLFDGHLSTQCIVREHREKLDFKKLLHEIKDQSCFENPGEVHKNYSISSDKKFLIFPCTNKNGILGYFILEYCESVSEREIILANQYARFLTIKQMEILLVENEEVASRRHTINRVFYDNSISEETIRRYLRILGTEVREFYYVIALESEQFKNSIVSYTQKNKVVAFFDSLGVKSFLIENLYSTLVIVLFFDKEEQPVSEILNKLYGFLKYGDMLLEIGCSKKNKDLRHLFPALKEAKESILLGGVLCKNTHIFFFDQFIHYAMFSKLLDTKEYLNMKGKIIAPITSPDGKNKLEMIKTLEVCINSETLKQAADLLHIHINTLYYRLDRIEQLTGESFYTNSGKQILSNAVMLYNLEKLYKGI